MSSLTAILQLIDLVQGESSSGSFTNWGDVTDGNFAILEATVGQTTTKAVTVADVALSTVEEYSLRINTTGVLTGNRAVTTSGRKGFWFVTNNCTGAFTLTFKPTAGTGIVVPQGGTVIGVCDGTNIIQIAGEWGWQLIQTAATTSIGAAAGWYVQTNGGGTITSFGAGTLGQVRLVKFGALGITHNGTSLILPGAADILCATGDAGLFICEGGSNWRCLSFDRASGVPVGYPAVSVDNTLPRFDGVLGKLQTSGIIVDDSNNVSGIGTFSTSGTATFGGVALHADGSAANPGMAFAAQGGVGFYRPTASQIAVMAGGSNEVGRFDGAGAGKGLHVGKIAFDPDVIGFSVATTGDTHNTANGVSVGTWTRQGSDGALMTCRKGTSTVGSISVTGAATAFNTSSDKRLKEDWQAFDAGPTIDRLEVWDFAWKASGERAYGVLAQDAGEVFPQAVTHDEDADIWQVDYSKYVPLLLAEIKALRQRVAALEAR